MVVRWQIIFKTLTQRGVSKRLTLQVYDASATKADEVINLLGAPEPISTGENSDDDYYDDEDDYFDDEDDFEDEKPRRGGLFGRNPAIFGLFVRIHVF